MTKQDIKTISGEKILLEAGNGNMDAISWANLHKNDIADHLAASGILLIRGLNIADGDMFSRMLTCFFDAELGAYIYRSTPRTEIHSNIYTASEYHPSETIPQHNENSYARTWPLYIGFLCRKKARHGGNTPVSDSRLAYREIPAEIRDEFERKKVMYVRNYSDVDLPWTEVFQTHDRKEVEKFCEEHDMQFEWTSSGLRTKQVNEAVRRHPVSREKIWFNQAHLFHVSNLDEDLQESLVELLGEENLPRNAYFGDGSPIDSAALSVIRDVYEKTKFTFQWENNDLLLLDNMLYTHGREPYEGERQVLVGMAKSCSPEHTGNIQ